MPVYDSSIREICTVSKVTESIKYILEEKFPIVWICGEISNFKTPSSGHAYFTLKDEKAQIAAVMFKGQRRQLKFELTDGGTIVGMGRITVYEPRGTYQIILEYIEPLGLGALQLAFEQLKRKLSAEGLFDPARRKPIPFLPGRIAIITSPTGAVIRDLLTIAGRRFENISIDIYPVRVQGPQAAREICDAIALANRQAQADVIILARGGGSLEDMAAFNSESVARSISNSRLPIVSAVGHETDFTISDFVADLRAPTPSAAAEMVLPMKTDLEQHCAKLTRRCIDAVLRHCREQRKRLGSIRRHLVHPRKSLQNHMIRVDDMTQRLIRAIAAWQRSRTERLRHEGNRLIAASPAEKISKYKSMVALLEYKLLNSCNNLISIKKMQHQTALASLSALDPYAILKRGYSITRTIPRGDVVLDSDKVSDGQQLRIILAMGSLRATVVDRRPDWELEKE